MYQIKPLRPNVIDPATSQPMPPEGVHVRSLYPADHLAQRQGDVSIEAIPVSPPATNPLPAEKQKASKSKP
jgi:hypothetical protein